MVFEPPAFWTTKASSLPNDSRYRLLAVVLRRLRVSCEIFQETRPLGTPINETTYELKLCLKNPITVAPLALPEAATILSVVGNVERNPLAIVSKLGIATQFAMERGSTAKHTAGRKDVVGSINHNVNISL